MGDDFAGDRLAGYVEVHERISAFYKKYPEGSLQGSFESQDGLIVYRAEAYRTPDDARPGVGYASEPVPGKTPYTKDSELMNAETSAWGRALAALGFEVHRGVASANEVRARSNGGGESKPPSPKQLDFFMRRAKEAGATGDEEGNIRRFAEQNLTGGRDGSMSKAIDALDGEGAGEVLERLRARVGEWQTTLSDLPADTEGMGTETVEGDEDPVPF